jgi:hypothetical protein
MKRIEYRVGQTIEVRGRLARVFRVWPFGTVDVEFEDGSCVRITGLRVYE